MFYSTTFSYTTELAINSRNETSSKSLYFYWGISLVLGVNFLIVNISFLFFFSFLFSELWEKAAVLQRMPFSETVNQLTCVSVSNILSRSF